ncbi:MAG: outer membrane beta-barrel protein [bacterium]
MRILKVCLTIILLGAVIAPAVSAQWSVPMEVYFGVGHSLPKDPAVFGDSFQGSYNLMVGVGARTFPFMEVVGKYEFHRFPSDIADMPGGTLSAKLLGVDGKATMKVPRFPLQPYLLLGMGMSWLRQSAWTAQRGPVFQGQTDLYFDFGAGAQLQFDGPLGVFGQAKMVHINMSQPNQKVSDNLRFWTITVGLKFTEGL